MARRVGRHAAVFVGFLLVAVVATWPLARHLDEAFTGPPSGDTGVYVWNVWVFTHELEQGRLPFYTSSIFAGPPGATPANLSLHNYTTAANVLAWPLIRLVGLVAAFNLVFLFNIALSGYAAWLLARSMTGREAEALIAGLVFALSPVLIARGAGHFSLVAAAPLPICALLIRRLGDTGHLRYAIGLGAAVAWATFSDAYYGVFCLLMAGVSLLIQFVSVERAVDLPAVRIVGLRRTLDLLLVAVGSFAMAIALRGGGTVAVLGIEVRAHTLYTPMLVITLLVLARLALAYPPRVSLRSGVQPARVLRAAVAAGVTMLLVLAPVLYALGDRVVHGQADWSSPLWRSSPRGIDLLGLFVPNPSHPLWGPAMESRLIAWAGRHDNAMPEVVGSLSLVALLVLVVAWWRHGWRPSRIRVGVAVFFTLLALGPFLHVAGLNAQIPLPWSVLRYVPILGLVRSPGRFAVLASLCVAVLLALALAHLGRRYPGRRRQILAVVGVLLAIELLPAPRPLYSAAIPAIYQTIAADPRPDVRVLELPVGIRDGTSSMGDFSPRTQYFQTAHGKGIIGGYLSRVSPIRRVATAKSRVLGALVTLSEGHALSADRELAARAGVDGFLRRTRVGYVVIDETRASPGLIDFAIDLFGLTLVAREGPLALYAPQGRTSPSTAPLH
jgi:hypothetical protein